MEDGVAAVILAMGTVKVKNGLELSSGVSSWALFFGCFTPSSFEIQASD